MPDGSNLCLPQQKRQPKSVSRLSQDVVDYLADISCREDGDRATPGWWVLPVLMFWPLAAVLAYFFV